MRIRATTAAAGLIAGAVVSYPVWWRHHCLTWGATSEEIRLPLPGDELLPEPDVVSTRAITINAPPAAIWPWLVQMGSGRGGVYTYDWIENLFGLQMHSTSEVLPQFQDTKLGDELPLGRTGKSMKVLVFEPQRTFAIGMADHSWVWIFALLPSDGKTRLISRNRIALRNTSMTSRLFNMMIMEPGSLVMERKMLLGIAERAERLALDRSGTAEPEPGGTSPPTGQAPSDSASNGSVRSTARA